MKAITATLGAALLLAACTTTATDDAERAAASRAIGFRTPAVARAVVNDATSAEFTAFDVWGWKTPAAGGAATQDFKRVPVTKNPSAQWNYEGTRYWQDDCTYRFYALFPSNLPHASYAADGTLTIGSYNAKANDDDLMAASVENIAGSLHQPVAFQFQHLLARVSVVVRAAQGVSATVSSASLYGIHNTGSYNSSTTSNSGWTVTGTASDAANPSYQRNGTVVINAGNELVYLKDLLTLPQSVADLKLNIDLERRVGNAAAEQVGGEFDLGSTITRWSAGQHYRYVLTVEADAITFSNFTVDQWGETHTGGDINIGQTN